MIMQTLNQMGGGIGCKAVAHSSSPHYKKPKIGGEG